LSVPAIHDREEHRRPVAIRERRKSPIVRPGRPEVFDTFIGHLGRGWPEVFDTFVGAAARSGSLGGV
jgi:hypothetical protein